MSDQSAAPDWDAASPSTCDDCGEWCPCLTLADPSDYAPESKPPLRICRDCYEVRCADR